MSEKIQYFVLMLIIILILGYFYKGVIFKTFGKIKTFLLSFVPNLDLIYI